MYYIDSHAHLSSSEIMPSIEEIVQRAQNVGVNHLLNICTDLQTLEDGIALNAKYPFIKNAGATTPHDVEKEGELAFPFFKQAAIDKKLVAIGETGLDYHYEYSSKQLQKQFLIRYLHLGAELQLPVIFHCREAFADLFAIADLEYPKKGPAVLHCFTGDCSEAEQVLERGWYLSLSGIVTFKKSTSLKEVAKMVPLSQLLIETDTPYLAPQSQRGKMNEPSFLPEIAQVIAELKGCSVKEVVQATSQNAKRLFF
jgi:TatD DNase family protein